MGVIIMIEMATVSAIETVGICHVMMLNGERNGDLKVMVMVSAMIFWLL